MLATLPFPAHGDFGRAGIHGRRTSVDESHYLLVGALCKGTLVGILDFNSGSVQLTAWQVIQERRAYSVITAQNERKIKWIT